MVVVVMMVIVVVVVVVVVLSPTTTTSAVVRVVVVVVVVMPLGATDYSTWVSGGGDGGGCGGGCGGGGREQLVLEGRKEGAQTSHMLLMANNQSHIKTIHI